MKFRLNTCLLLGFLLINPNLYSQDDNLSSETISKVGTSVAQFLKLGISARTIGMGGAFVAVANDVSTIYWNPSGITNLPTTSLGVTHTQWFADISHDFFGITVPLSTSDFIAVHAIALNTGELEITTVTQPEGTGVFYDVSDLAIGLSYARALTDRFSAVFVLMGLP